MTINYIYKEEIITVEANTKGLYWYTTITL